MGIEVSQLPGAADNTWQYNGVPFCQDNVTTVSGWQYAVWWDSNRHPIIGRRTAGGAEWTTFDLSAVAENPLASPVDYDGHNDICIGVDTSGRLHVAANMHVHPMRYVRSAGAHTLTSWEASNKPGFGATEITYPQFVRLSDGRLLLFYRVGVSGLGTIYVQRWDDTAGAWLDPLQLIDGPATGENAYIHHVGVGPDGSLHLAIVWRNSGSADTNNDLSHMMSLDGGVTWQSQGGTPLALPVNHGTAPLVYDTAVSGSGILNTGGLDVDTDGRPHIATHVYNTEGTASRVLYSRWTGAAWANTMLMPDWTYRMPVNVSAINGEVARPMVACSSTGRVLVVYRNNVDKPETLRIREVTEGRPQTDAAILNVPLYAWEPSFDTRALRDYNRLEMLVTPIRSADTTLPAADGDWTSKPLGILTVTLADLDSILAGSVLVPSEIADTTAPPPPPAPPPVAAPEVRADVTWYGCDLVTGAVIAELPEITGRISRVLGAYTSSALTLPIPLGGPGAVPINVVETATAPGQTMLVAVVNDVPVWGGIVLARQGGTDALLRLGCVTPEGYLARRYVSSHTWTQQDEAAVIGAGLVGDASAEGIGLTLDAPATGTLRDRTYADKDDKTVYATLRELMGVEGGPEWTVDLDWSDGTHTGFVKYLRLRPRVGAESSSPNAVFSSLTGSDTDYTYEEDYTDGRGANHVIATSSGEGDSRPQSDPATDIPAGWPRWERRWSPSSSITSQDVLDAHAVAELALRRNGARTLRINARWDATPRLGIDWALGDDVGWELYGHRHPAGLIGQGRVIGWELDIQAGIIHPILWQAGDEVGEAVV